jgi:hypothetical protein
MELKYCERCGSLWLRREGVNEVYCDACEPWMAEVKLASRENRTAAANQEQRPGLPFREIFGAEDASESDEVPTIAAEGGAVAWMADAVRRSPDAGPVRAAGDLFAWSAALAVCGEGGQA